MDRIVTTSQTQLQTRASVPALQPRIDQRSAVNKQAGTAIPSSVLNRPMPAMGIRFIPDLTARGQSAPKITLSDVPEEILYQIADHLRLFDIANLTDVFPELIGKLPDYSITADLIYRFPDELKSIGDPALKLEAFKEALGDIDRLPAYLQKILFRRFLPLVQALPEQSRALASEWLVESLRVCKWPGVAKLTHVARATAYPTAHAAAMAGCNLSIVCDYFGAWDTLDSLARSVVASNNPRLPFCKVTSGEANLETVVADHHLPVEARWALEKRMAADLRSNAPGSLAARGGNVASIAARFGIRSLGAIGKLEVRAAKSATIDSAGYAARHGANILDTMERFGFQTAKGDEALEFYACKSREFNSPVYRVSNGERVCDVMQELGMSTQSAKNVLGLKSIKLHSQAIRAAYENGGTVKQMRDLYGIKGRRALHALHTIAARVRRSKRDPLAVSPP